MAGTKNLGLGDRVRIVGTQSSLDGMECHVMGFSARYHNNDFCIIGLPSAIWMEPFNSYVIALSMTDACLEVIARGDGSVDQKQFTNPEVINT